MDETTNLIQWNIVVITKSKHKDDEYATNIYEGIKKLDSEADVVIGSVFHDQFNSGLTYAIGLIDSYIRSKENLSKDDVGRYKQQMRHIIDGTTKKTE